jgi:3-methyladenine DNA glycosylase/8-oxoguanine DNA glycosylase
VTPGPATRTVPVPWPVDLPGTLGRLRRGGEDPAVRRTTDGAWWWATGTPCGPALLRLAAVPADGALVARAWGAGAPWVLDGVPELAGLADDPSSFRPRPEHRVLVDAWRRRPHLRTPRTRAVVEALAGAAVEQVVTGVEAHRAWRDLLRRFGDPAPGPATTPGGPAAGMHLPPSPRQWAAVPTWEWLRAGVEERRRRVVQHAVRAAGGLERTLALDPPAVEPALRSLPGVGVWTAAEVRHRAHGDPDAFSFADYHVAKDVSWALTGEVLDDDGCAEVIECYRGHRYRVQRLLELAGAHRPRRGPRTTLPRHTPSATRMRS